jgi:hypothetical protein
MKEVFRAPHSSIEYMTSFVCFDNENLVDDASREALHVVENETIYWSCSQGISPNLLH